MKCELAEIKWFRENEGGRRNLPLGTGFPPYHTVIEFISPTIMDTEKGHSVSWSLVVEKIKVQSDDYHWLASVRFLVEAAPHERLIPGVEFYLLEGAKRVARGRILKR